ncbi:MAG: multifunctional CCA tRNA nucleotidyl transferase/2'3'-cyclic phosphodiesterase/2'nucleotidase/phosphatase [Chloroflexota bacterium]|nr:MAG: multifunctional CCA tRNA nucleotidyl transferase/2'3'-cyclic phosphodiesterase/2'nucleotidase/phosphatase [Chloroflexota bacterium]
MKIFRVGGAVRDRLLGVEPKDQDFVIVGATPEELEEKGFTKTVGADFPVFLLNGEEHALARTERKVGLGHTEFVTRFDPTVTLEEDLKRRDISINAMAEDPETGEVIDPFNGQDDLKRGLMRHVSPAFAEDPLRVLRVARFAARFGFTIAPETIKLMKLIASRGELRHLTKERVWSEVARAMMTDQPQHFFRVLRDVDATDPLFGKSDIAFIAIDQRLMVISNGDMNERQRWMSVFFDVGDDIVNHFLHKVRVPNEIADAIKFACSFSKVDFTEIESVMAFMNRWNQWRDQTRLEEMVQMLGVVGSQDIADMSTFMTAVVEAGLINFSSMSSVQQENLVGPEIGACIAAKRQLVIMRWIESVA